MAELKQKKNQNFYLKRKCMTKWKNSKLNSACYTHKHKNHSNSSKELCMIQLMRVDAWWMEGN
jgi:hypothetical protein